MNYEEVKRKINDSYCRERIARALERIAELLERICGEEEE